MPCLIYRHPKLFVSIGKLCFYDEIFRVLNCTTILSGEDAPDKGIVTTLNHSALTTQRSMWKKTRLNFPGLQWSSLGEPVFSVASTFSPRPDLMRFVLLLPCFVLFLLPFCVNNKDCCSIHFQVKSSFWKSKSLWSQLLQLYINWISRSLSAWLFDCGVSSSWTEWISAWMGRCSY